MTSDLVIKTKNEGRRIPSVETSHNKRLSEIAVGVETGSHLLPLSVDDSSSIGTPRPRLRKATGRYQQFTLLRCEAVDYFLGRLYVKEIIQ